MWTSTDLSAADQAAVVALADAASKADGIYPLNEAATLALRVPGAATHFLTRVGDTLTGYAQWHHADRSGLIVVAPTHRKAALGGRLIKALRGVAGTEISVWAFGNHPAAQALATNNGLVPARTLLEMERPLTDLLSVDPAPGVTLRTYSDSDLESLHALNAAAFHDHPEQGRLTLDDLRLRMSEEWFDPAGLFLAELGGQPVGFHWTKRESATDGEVYVIGVVPSAAGKGVGKTLLWAGLRHLADIGCTRVNLFVDLGNTAAIELYERAGFSVARTDILFRAREGVA
jgi:mycothiol synthase